MKFLLTLLIATHLKDRTEASVREAMMAQVSSYKSRGLVVSMILFDGEGAVAASTTRLQEAGIVVNTSAKNEHVPEIERAGRQLKERVRAIWNTLPYNWLTS